MNKRLAFATGLVLLAISITLVIWQSSFSFGEFGPTTMPQAYVFWAVSILVFLLTVTLSFMLLRTALKLYVERQRKHEGSRIKSRLVFGALALSFMPVLFLVLFSVSILNFNLLAWFTRPAQNMRWSLIQVGNSMDHEAQKRAMLLARMLASQPKPSDAELKKFCADQNVLELWVEESKGKRTFWCEPVDTKPRRSVEGHAPLSADAMLAVRLVMPMDFAEKQREIQREVAEFDEFAKQRKEFRNLYLLLLSVITLFILFVATWIAQFMARQLSDPISALLIAASEVRKGNLSHRIEHDAMDEMGALVRSFNEMTSDLEANTRELERRRRFTETILESIPTAVLSLDGEGKIQRANPALRKLFPHLKADTAVRMEDLLPAEEMREFRYLANRARRTGVASRQLEFRRDRRTYHLGVTIAALEENTGFVVVLEDTSEMLRTEKAAAWHEVASYVAHEIKNPLTPIALSAERILRQIDRLPVPPDATRVIRECCVTTLREVESVKTLVNEFAQFARFPAAQLTVCDVNEVVENALTVFQGRLDRIDFRKQLAGALPPVNLDPEQFKRVVVNLVDNAAEAMQDSLVRRLTVVTRLVMPDTIELTVADTGHGVSPEDRERLFLPYFSTKGRGTGLGLAIVSHILNEHHAQIRVEDNQPAGAKFIIELRALPVAESEWKAVEVNT